MEKLIFEINESAEFANNYKMMIGSILPRPIAVVSTRNEDGSNNIAPFSFFTGVSAKPFILAFCPLVRSSTGERKDTYKNIQRSGEFVINVCPEKIVDQINLCSTELAYGEDEFAYSGLTATPASIIDCPMLLESPISFECRLRDIIDYGDQPGAGSLITGEVVKAHIAKDVYDQGRLITKEWMPIGRGAGSDWMRSTDIIQKERLMKAQIQK